MPLPARTRPTPCTLPPALGPTPTDSSQAHCLRGAILQTGVGGKAKPPRACGASHRTQTGLMPFLGARGLPGLHRAFAQHLPCSQNINPCGSGWVLPGPGRCHCLQPAELRPPLGDKSRKGAPGWGWSASGAASRVDSLRMEWRGCTCPALPHPRTCPVNLRLTTCFHFREGSSVRESARGQDLFGRQSGRPSTLCPVRGRGHVQGGWSAAGGLEATAGVTQLLEAHGLWGKPQKE